MLMQIFLSRSHPSPDMPLRLVHIQDFARFSRQGGVDLEEPFGDIWWCQVRNKKNRNDKNHFRQISILKNLLLIVVSYSFLISLQQYPSNI